MPRSIEALIAESNNLISFPAVVSQFNNAINSESYELEELGAILQLDPILTARLLQLANSAYFGTAVPAETVKDAIFRLGVKQTRDLVYGISAKNAFDGVTNTLVSNEEFWKHCLICAISAQTIAKTVKIHSPDTLFTAGLLHDIGDLILFTLEPEGSTEALKVNVDDYDGSDQSSAEISIFGFDHAEIGGKLAQQWGFPEVLRTCIANHHKPSEEHDFSQQVAVISVANTIAALIEVDCHDLSQGDSIDESTWALLGADESIIEGCFNAVQEEYDEMSKMLFS
jgi:putative nucleotidyltransferase with HDIG domain